MALFILLAIIPGVLPTLLAVAILINLLIIWKPKLSKALIAAPIFAASGVYWLYKSTHYSKIGLHEWDIFLYRAISSYIVPFHFICAGLCLYHFFRHRSPAK